MIYLMDGRTRVEIQDEHVELARYTLEDLAGGLLNHSSQVTSRMRMDAIKKIKQIYNLSYEKAVCTVAAAVESL
jgi:hypothetical protein